MGSTSRTIAAWLAAGLVLGGPGPAAADYGWMLSASASDPHRHEGEPLGGDTCELHLWLECATEDGVSAAAFCLQPPSGVTVVAFSPRSGFLNGGSAQDLQLAVGGCPTGPVLAGTWTLAGVATGSFCLGPGAGHAFVATVDCSPASPQIHAARQIGFGAGETPACDEGSPCAATSVATLPWGRLKGLFRD